MHILALALALTIALLPAKPIILQGSEQTGLNFCMYVMYLYLSFPLCHAIM